MIAENRLIQIISLDKAFKIVELYIEVLLLIIKSLLCKLDKMSKITYNVSNNLYYVVSIK